MILQRFTRRERILVSITIAIVFSTIFYGFVIEPLSRTYSRLNNQIRSGSLKLQRNYKLLNQKDSIKAEYEKYSPLIKPLPSEEEEIAAVLKVIEAIARENNIYITNIRPQPVRARLYYDELTFELIAEADIENLIKFIYDLQTSKNLLRVKKLTLSSTSTKDNLLKAIMEITKPSIKIIEI